MQIEKEKKGLVLPQEPATHSLEKALKEVHSSKVSRNPAPTCLAFRPMTQMGKAKPTGFIMLKSGEI